MLAEDILRIIAPIVSATQNSVAKSDAVFTQENSSIKPRNRETAVFCPENSLRLSRSTVLGMAVANAFVQSWTPDSWRFWGASHRLPAKGCEIRMQQDGETLHYDFDSLDVFVTNSGEEV